VRTLVRGWVRGGGRSGQLGLISALSQISLIPAQLQNGVPLLSGRGARRGTEWRWVDFEVKRGRRSAEVAHLKISYIDSQRVVNHFRGANIPKIVSRSLTRGQPATRILVFIVPVDVSHCSVIHVLAVARSRSLVPFQGVILHRKNVGSLASHRQARCTNRGGRASALLFVCRY